MIILFDIALVNTSISNIRTIPLGILWLEASLSKAGYDVVLADYQLSDVDNKPAPINLSNFCLELDVPIIGLSVMYSSLPTVLAAVKILKKRVPDIVIILGGPAVSDRPVDIVNSFPVDFIVVGEGEVTIVELMNGLRDKKELSKIPGICFRDNSNNIVFTGSSRRILNPNELAFPDYSKIDFENYNRTMAVVTMRGCPYYCRFCSAHSVWGCKVTQRTIDNVVEELLLLRGKINFIEFHDDTFIANPKRAKQLIISIKEAGIDVPWTCNCRADLLTPDLANDLAQLGCQEVLIGIESGSNRILKIIGKNLTTDICRQSIRLAQNTIGKVTTSYIWGYPEENMEDLYETLMSIAEDNLLDGVTSQIGLLSPIPGSPIGASATNIRFNSRLNPAGLFPDNEYLDNYPELVELIKGNPNLFKAFYYVDHPTFKEKLKLVYQFCQQEGVPLETF